jgi:polyisoprenoid-binding protein YceI
MKLEMAVALLGAALTALAPAAAAAPAWRALDGGRIGFTASWEGSDFDGVFHHFEAAIAFAPDDLASSRFDVKVDVTSADTQSSDRDEALADPEWFDYAHHPQATFVASSFSTTGEGHYEAAGTLTIKGISHELRFPFTWDAHDGKAHLLGETTVVRTDFHIGEGEWADGDTIGLDVRVRVDLSLETADAN